MTTARRDDQRGEDADAVDDTPQVDAEHPLPVGLGEHVGGYGALSDEWDKTGGADGNPKFSSAASGLESFRGDVVGQVDINNDGTGSW